MRNQSGMIRIFFVFKQKTAYEMRISDWSSDVCSSDLHKHMKSTNMLERFNEEIRRRTYVVRIFPNAPSCLRLVRALAVETHENWLEANRYLNMDELREQKKTELRKAA